MTLSFSPFFAVFGPMKKQALPLPKKDAAKRLPPKRRTARKARAMDRDDASAEMATVLGLIGSIEQGLTLTGVLTSHQIKTLLDHARRVSEAIWAVAKPAGVNDELVLTALVNSARENVQRIHNVKESRMKPIGATMRDFPVLATRSPSFIRNIHGALERVGLLKRSEDPNSSLRGADDDFTQAAIEFRDHLTAQGWEIEALATQNWDWLRLYLRQDHIDSFLKQGNRGAKLAKQIKLRASEGKIWDKVRERVLDRLNSILGLKTKEMKALPQRRRIP